jgi:single-stranded-DNA-specific exonuclease
MTKYELRPAIPPEAAEGLKEFPELLGKLLFSRGISGRDEAEKFLRPAYAPHDPFLMKDMEQAVGRILSAIESNERIAIFSDYDADGIPGAVVLHDFFKKIGFENFENYIPDRHSEGFGLNAEAVKEVAARGARVLITVDCGTADLEEIKLAGELGMDVIVTDHHILTGPRPPAFAVLNPKQLDCGYPEKMLCGAGVVFKLVEALLIRLRLSVNGQISTVPPAGWEKWLLDMVAVATLSDMVPLWGENRVFARYGLAVLRKSRRPGLREIFSLLKVAQGSLAEDDVTFSLTPRLNAASRMGDPRDAFRLLATTDEDEATRLAKHLDSKNSERKGVVAAMIKEIKHAVAARYPAERKVIVVGNPNWKPALLGLAAGNIAEEFSCPVFLWGRDGGFSIKGSCRAGNGVGVLDLMQRVSADVFSEFGGHDLAGGFSVPHEKIHLLPTALEKAFDSAPMGSDAPHATHASHRVPADAALSLSDVNWSTWRMIESLMPFGVGNPKPVFVFNDVTLAAVRQFGKEANHLGLEFESSGAKVSAVSFFTKPDAWGKELVAGKRFTVAATIEKSTFRNFPELRLRLVDIF